MKSLLCIELQSKLEDKYFLSKKNHLEYEHFKINVEVFFYNNFKTGNVRVQFVSFQFCSFRQHFQHKVVLYQLENGFHILHKRTFCNKSSHRNTVFLSRRIRK